jgi:DNA-binding response OmpR family regulator
LYFEEGERVMTKKNILVVDDDRDLAHSIKAYFEARGYGVRMAHSGEEGMGQIAAERPDLILLDIMMDNDADGFNLAYRLKEENAYREIPIVILSGYMDHLRDKFKSFEFVMGRDWPAVEDIKKPASLTRISEAVERLLA